MNKIDKKLLREKKKKKHRKGGGGFEIMLYKMLCYKEVLSKGLP